MHRIFVSTDFFSVNNRGHYYVLYTFQWPKQCFICIEGPVGAFKISNLLLDNIFVKYDLNELLEKRNRKKPKTKVQIGQGNIKLL